MILFQAGVISVEIQALRDRVLYELTTAHDYYEETKLAWSIVDRFVSAGNVFANQNLTTGTVTTQTDLVAKSRGYIAVQLAEATFQQFVSIFESFFFDLLRLWLTAYPQNLIGKQVDFRDVLDAPDKDAITQLVIGKELNEVLYKRPADWFVYLDARVKLGCPTADEIGRIAEAKASRNVLIHNRGVAGKIYLSKSGTFARYGDGARIDIPDPYHRETWELFRKVVAEVSNGCAAKAP